MDDAYRVIPIDEASGDPVGPSRRSARSSASLRTSRTSALLAMREVEE
jgi:hypothetical protein